MRLTHKWDWQTFSLEQLCERVTVGIATSVTQHYRKTGVPIIRNLNIKPNQLDEPEILHISPEFAKANRKRAIRHNDVLVVRTGNVGQACLAPQHFDGGQTFTTLIATPKRDKLNPAFLCYHINSRLGTEQIWRLTGDSGRGNLNAGEFQNYVIDVPPLHDQVQIATLLNSWSYRIQQTKKLLEAKTRFKRGLMQELLTGKKRLQGFAGKPWHELKLSDVFERVTRKNDEGNCNVVTVSARRGFVRQDEFFGKLVASENLDHYFLIERGDFCYNKSYTNDYLWGATKRLKEFEKAVVTTLYICFRLKDTAKHSGDFFEQTFEACLLDHGLTKIAHEGGRAHGLLNVTPSDFFSLKVSVPNYDEQTAVARVLQTADREIDLLKRQLAALKRQQRGLTQRLLTGQIDLNIKGQARKESVPA